MNIHFHRAPPGGVADEAALEQFQKQWATYQKLVDAARFPTRRSGRCFTTRSGPSLCHSLSLTSPADAGQMKLALAGTEVNHYHGIQSPRSDSPPRT
jgi:hypothetical protein